MKKLPKLSESKFQKFEENQLQNAHMIFGGYVESTTVLTGSDKGKNDQMNRATSDTGHKYLDDNGVWKDCDFRVNIPLNPSDPWFHGSILEPSGATFQV